VIKRKVKDYWWDAPGLPYSGKELVTSSTGVGTTYSSCSYFMRSDSSVCTLLHSKPLMSGKKGMHQHWILFPVSSDVIISTNTNFKYEQEKNKFEIM
jgi:hypothetical protein